MKQYSFFITCPRYMESLLAKELADLGGLDIEERLAGASASGDLAFAYRVCLWSRLANRVLLVLKSFAAETTDDLYTGIKDIAWEEHFCANATLWIDFKGENEFIRNTLFGAQKVKDAISDRLRDLENQRPTIDKEEPDVRVNVFLDRKYCTVNIDLSGESLHRRSYREQAGSAPLKENLAAAILIRANWPELAKCGAPLVDPMCGSGTFLIEGLLMAADIAPGLFRPYFGFLGWKQHDIALWKSLLTEADARKEKGLANLKSCFYGTDANTKTIQIARHNLALLDLEDKIVFEVCELANWHKPQAFTEPGLMVTNPPYGERLSDEPSLLFLYKHLAKRLKQEFGGWEAGVFTGNPVLAKAMNFREHHSYRFNNGTIPCQLLLITVRGFEEKVVEESAQIAVQKFELSEGARMIANRLQKNKKHLSSWLKKENITCYRVYDADMPEYAAAIDWYEGNAYIQEYAAPKTVDPEKASKRFQEIIMAVQQVFELPPNKIFIKTRSKQKGANQYQKVAKLGRFIEVHEKDCRFFVNLTDYLDTGLFLDHRPVRLLLRDLVVNKVFLNLFCYTATASVHAARAGARRSVSVDMSPTYTEWARKNIALNGFSDNNHEVVEADCVKWLRENRIKFDVILLDPPTFSNSKRTDTVFDVQRDQVDIIRLAMQSLKPQGVLIFSTNYRRFKLEEILLEKYDCQDITNKTFDPDFKRDKKLHQCWLIREK